MNRFRRKQIEKLKSNGMTPKQAYEATKYGKNTNGNQSVSGNKNEQSNTK